MKLWEVRWYGTLASIIFAVEGIHAIKQLFLLDMPLCGLVFIMVLIGWINITYKLATLKEIEK